MKAYHVTPRRNKTSIMKHGLLTHFAVSVPGTTGFVTRRGVPWMVGFIRELHGERDVCVLYVNVGRTRPPPHYLRMFRIARDIPPEKILGELAWED